MKKTANDFQKLWRKAFGELPPLGYFLRKAVPERWTRFHSLPESKRYAKNDDEKAIIRDRANTLGDQIFGDRKPIWLAAVYRLLEENTHPEFFNTFAMEPAFTWEGKTTFEEDHTQLTIYAAPTIWRSGSFDELFDDIAVDREQAFFFDPSNNTVLAPYDGGFDLIGRDVLQRLNFERKFQGWMSKRSDKM